MTQREYMYIRNTGGGLVSIPVGLQATSSGSGNNKSGLSVKSNPQKTPRKHIREYK